MICRALLAAGLVMLALPAVASADATLTDTGSGLVYQASQGDIDSIHISSSGGSVFVLPVGEGVRVTSPSAGCSNPPPPPGTGAASCPIRNNLTLHFEDKDDFANIQGGPTVTLWGGAGNDRAFTLSSRLIMHGEAGDDQLQGGPGFDILDGGADDDLIDPVGKGDQVTGGSGFDTARYGGATPVIVTLDDVANDGVAGDNQNIKSDVEKVIGGDGGDELEGNALANTLSGDDGADTLTGNGGADTLLGDAGNDTIQARDGVADDINCGPGADTAIVDPFDTVASCETVQYADSDSDGFNATLDCNDQNSTIHPGATDVRGNGVDEDCSGADLPALPPPPPPPPPAGPIDADHDGVVKAQDCNDANAAIRPGAPDLPGNGIDEDCDGRDATFAVIDSPIKSGFSVFARSTKVTRLVVRKVPAGAAVKATCKGGGCRFHSRNIPVQHGKARLTRLLRGRRLKPRAVLVVRIAAPDMVGKVVRYKFRKRKLPKSAALCLPPGAAKPGACGS